jgi:pyrimidine-nucleoside phosphorylase
MRAVDVITQKRDGHALSREAIQTFVDGVTDGSWPDYQAAALLMAIVLRGLNNDETWHLTDAMARSGERIDLSDVPGVKVGKHSTGGVGDKLSIVVVPLVAACGAVVPKMSGRGLGYTGGTLDKLESIPGFQVGLTIDEFKAALRDVGACIVGQTAALAPADKKLYALRDVTGTVQSVPLIASSIMSKKLAEGSDALVLDVKCGDGAIVQDLDAARALAGAMVSIGADAGLRTEALITNMDAPLGAAVGNALEVAESIEVLRGHGPDDLRRMAIVLAARMLVVSTLYPTQTAAEEAVTRAITSGAGLDRFRRLIARQGGDPAVVDDVSRLPSVSTRVPLRADRAGYVHRVRAGLIGRASHILGAGREQLDGAVDPAVGILMRVRPGDQVKSGDALLELCHRQGRGLETALALCRQAVTIGEAPAKRRPHILGEMR